MDNRVKPTALETRASTKMVGKEDKEEFQAHLACPCWRKIGRDHPNSPI